MALLDDEAIKRTDLVQFLANFGIQPVRADGPLYLYNSPLIGHPLTPPSLTVNRSTNTWHETVTKENGDFLDFATRFFRCTIGELYERLSVAHDTPAGQPSADTDILLVDTTPIRSSMLLRMLWTRRIPLHVAQRYCTEAVYQRKHKTYSALAFPCDAGGYELFDPHHHYRIPPTGPTLLIHQAPDISVLADALDLMPLVTILASNTDELPDLLVLNEPVPLHTLAGMLDRYRYKHFFLPHTSDWTDLQASIPKNAPGYRDHHGLYAGYKALNNWFCHPGNPDYPRLDIPRQNEPYTP